MLGLMVRFDLTDADAAATFDRLAAQAGATVRASEPGTVTYTMHRVVGEPLARVFYELYRDEAALDDHRGREHTRRFLADIGPLVTARRMERVVPATDPAGGAV